MKATLKRKGFKEKPDCRLNGDFGKKARIIWAVVEIVSRVFLLGDTYFRVCDSENVPLVHSSFVCACGVEGGRTQSPSLGLKEGAQSIGQWESEKCGGKGMVVKKKKVNK